jgi:hypothetical protein
MISIVQYEIGNDGDNRPPWISSVESMKCQSKLSGTFSTGQCKVIPWKCVAVMIFGHPPGREIKYSSVAQSSAAPSQDPVPYSCLRKTLNWMTLDMFLQTLPNSSSNTKLLLVEYLIQYKISCKSIWNALCDYGTRILDCIAVWKLLVALYFTFDTVSWVFIRVTIMSVNPISALFAGTKLHKRESYICVRVSLYQIHDWMNDILKNEMKTNVSYLPIWAK